MSGLHSRRKRNRVELAIAELIGARIVSRAYQAGHDLEPAIGEDRILRIECKARADGFGTLYRWLQGRDALILKADRQERLVVVRLSLAAQIAKRTASVLTLDGSDPGGANIAYLQDHTGLAERHRQDHAGLSALRSLVTLFGVRECLLIGWNRSGVR
jgi:hypothetical protein